MSTALYSPEECLHRARTVLQKQGGISDKEWLEVAPLLKIKNVGNKHSLQEAGAVVDKHYFQLNGLVRFFYLTPNGKESNKAFYGGGHLIGSLSAIILNEPSRYAIETLEPCQLVEFPTAIMRPRYSDTGGWQQHFSYCCQTMLIRNERREAELLTLSAKDRFLQFASNFPDYMQRIPQYHIASYLGITPVALSKYKNEWLKDLPLN